MAEERLPIKFFAKREVDNMRVEAGGSSDLPKFVLGEKELYDKSKTLVNIVENLKKEVIRKEKSNSLIPTVFKAKIIDDAAAKTHRKEVSRLFRTSVVSNILGLADTDEIIVKLDDLRETDILIKRLKNIQRYAYALSCIDTISEFQPIISKSKSDEATDYKVKLINFQNYEQNRSIRNYFEKSMIQLGLEVKKTNYTEDHIIYNLKSVTMDTLEKINEEEAFQAVFSIEPMPKYMVSLDMDEYEATINITNPVEGKKYTTVGILDNGIADIPHLRPWLTEERYTAYPEPYMKKNHGTFVSGIVVYGDKLESSDWVGIEGVKILDACVFPDTDKEGIDEDDLVHNIKEAIKLYHENVKIWNLSISIVKEVEEYSFSDFAIALDEL